MLPKNTGLWIVSISTAGALAWFTWTERRDREAREAPLHKELRTLAGELRAVKNQTAYRFVAVSSPLPEASAPSLNAMRTAGTDAAPAAQEAAVPTPQAVDASTTQVVGRVEHRLATEPPDPAWRSEGLGQIRSAAESTGSPLLDADCRSTVCRVRVLVRVRVEHDSQGTQEALADEFSAKAPFSGGCRYRPSKTSGGYPVSTLYVARRGHRLRGRKAALGSWDSATGNWLVPPLFAD